MNKLIAWTTACRKAWFLWESENFPKYIVLILVLGELFARNTPTYFSCRCGEYVCSHVFANCELIEYIPPHSVTLWFAFVTYLGSRLFCVWERLLVVLTCFRFEYCIFLESFRCLCCCCFWLGWLCVCALVPVRFVCVRVCAPWRLAWATNICAIPPLSSRGRAAIGGIWLQIATERILKLVCACFGCRVCGAFRVDREAGRTLGSAKYNTRTQARIHIEMPRSFRCGRRVILNWHYILSQTTHTFKPSHRMCVMCVMCVWCLYVKSVKLKHSHTFAHYQV